MAAESGPVWPEDRVQQGLQMRQEAIWGSDGDFFSLEAEPETEPKALRWAVSSALYYLNCGWKTTQIWGQPGLYNETLSTE